MFIFRLINSQQSNNNHRTMHAANVPAPHDHSQQNQAPPHAVLNTALFS